MSTITLSMREELKEKLRKEHNYSELVARLLLGYFNKQEGKKEITENELKLKEIELEKLRIKKRLYKIKCCNEWIMSNYTMSFQEAEVLAIDWVENMWDMKDCISIHYYMITKGFMVDGKSKA